MISRGSLVYDRADRRHVGVVRSISWKVWGREGLATIRWEDTGWLSIVRVSDLRPASSEPAARFVFSNPRRTR